MRPTAQEKKISFKILLLTPGHPRAPMQRCNEFKVVPLLASTTSRGFPGGTVVKNPPANAGSTKDAGSSAGWRRYPGVVNGNILQHS